MKQWICLMCALLCAASLALPAAAAELEDGERYCFGTEDFAAGDAELTGICITRLPEPKQGTVMLGDRCLRPGDVLTANQIPEMTFVAAAADESSTASISYLPVFANGISGEATMTLSIRGKENKPPIAEDSAFETYKNLEVTGKLRVRDPEGQEMQFTITRQPKRGTITIREDGSFTYTPNKNKVGVDSFTFTASDPAGKVSRETTVTVTILKPSDARQYADTCGKSCRFAAEWMKNTGIFVGETVDGNPCFSPDRPVSRGEFLTMLVKSLKIPVDPELKETGYADAPDWLKPYLAAAIRSGLIAALPAKDTFNADEAITAEDAAAMLCTALNLTVDSFSNEEPASTDYLSVAAQNGFLFDPDSMVTRSTTAEIMYQVSLINK